MIAALNCTCKIIIRQMVSFSVLWRVYLEKLVGIRKYLLKEQIQIDQT